MTKIGDLAASNLTAFATETDITVARGEMVSRGDLSQRLDIAQERLHLLLQATHELSTSQQPSIDGIITELNETLADLKAATEELCLKNQELSTFYAELQTHNANLEAEVQRRTEEVQRSLTFESMLKRITDKVRDSLDESQILQTAVKELTLVLGLGGCNAALYDLDRGISTICYEYIDSIPASRGKVALMDRYPEIYRQLQKGMYFQFCSLQPNPERGQVALLSCPIFVDVDPEGGNDRGILGDLWLIHHKDYVFNEFEIRMVEQVANQCAIAIRQARLYKAAQAQVQELERLNRLKDEFLSTVSHELRTPISNVRMAIHMLKQAPSEERRLRYLEVLETESAREAELINDLLDLQRLEASSYPIEVETVDLKQWLTQLVEPFQSRIQNRQQSLEIQCVDPVPPLSSDLSILKRILAELLNNACKYTPSGQEITFKTQYSSNQNDSHCSPSFQFKIANRAEIPSSELPHIFEKFYRVPHADPWKQGGTGLGLALVQKLVSQLGGVIQVESTQGWTTFTVEIPACLVADSESINVQ